MATNELAIRFTENRYLTKSEVARELKMSIIDSIWSNILSYRTNFYHYLTLKSIDKESYLFCLCPNVSNQINSIAAKELNLTNSTKFISGSSEERIFEKHCLEEIVKLIARKNKINLNDEQIKEIISGKDDTNSIVVNYIKTLKKFHDSTSIRDLDIDYLSELFASLYNLNEITSFYRENDDGNPDNKVIIDRLYTCAPSQLIDSLMNNLVSFLKITTLDKNVKALTSLYYFQYVKPFANNNDELGLLFAKSILAKELGPVAYYLPLETIIVDGAFEVSKIIADIKKCNNDITYYILFAFKYLNKSVDHLNDFVISMNANGLKEDFYQLDNKETNNTIEESKIVKEDVVDLSSKKETIKDIKPEEYRKPAVEPVKAEPKVVEKVIYKESPITQESRAFDLKITKIDEKEILEIIERLIELDPELSKKEARFYASHCTIGRLYSIAQFKKDIGCVYETARTSMDHLAALGYYKKQQIKNKFLYTPLSRR